MKKIYIRKRKNNNVEYTTSGKNRFSYTTNGHGKYALKLAELSLKYNRKFNNYFEEKYNHYNICIYNKTFGYFKVKISKKDFDKVQMYKWNVIKDYKTFYVINKKAGLLHRYIMGINNNLVIDHIDGNGLNNTRKNLRVVPRYINMRNMHKDNIIGIYFHKGNYDAVIRTDKNKVITKSFNISKYGKQKAFDLALKWRKNKEIEYGYYNNLERKIFHNK